MSIDPVALARDLIRRASVTPVDGGAMDVVEAALSTLGFTCRRMKFRQIENLYARRGSARPNLCFAGHTDVVPPGDAAAWSLAPFAAEVTEGVLFGRGAVDMKSAIAAFIAAIPAEVAGSISLLITGDEEGVAEDGTCQVVQALAAEGEVIDHCLVGEPTSNVVLGDMIKIGRRGSLNAEILVEGVQGHVAYPHKAANPVPILIGLLARLGARELDHGYTGFQPSNLEVTTVDVGNATTNLIPAKASARLNIRFNPSHTGAALSDWLADEARIANQGFEGRVIVTPRISGEAFLTLPGDFTAVVERAISAVTGMAPELSTTGGTSDARFIRALCPVVELGLVGATMHAVDERVSVADILTLSQIYRRLITDYFATFSS